MPKKCYEQRQFRPKTLELIETANTIIEEYAEQGYDLTLRQLYYQFVARGLLANDDKEYKRLGATVSDARLAGLIDWDRIEDRTRTLRGLSHWENPAHIVEACAQQFRVNRWEDQPVRPEVWIEKDALVGVLVGICEELDVNYFSCRGYTSQSAMWRAAQRLIDYETHGQETVIFHLGDHDPSGIDMTRDIKDRLNLFGAFPRVERLALNMDQVEQYRPPPNPAKLTDTRASDYISKYGDESWELDALEPRTITTLIREAVRDIRDPDLWVQALRREEDGQAQLRAVVDHWSLLVRSVM